MQAHAHDVSLYLIILFLCMLAGYNLIVCRHMYLINIIIIYRVKCNEVQPATASREERERERDSREFSDLYGFLMPLTFDRNAFIHTYSH